MFRFKLPTRPSTRSSVKALCFFLFFYFFILCSLVSQCYRCAAVKNSTVYKAIDGSVSICFDTCWTCVPKHIWLNNKNHTGVSFWYCYSEKKIWWDFFFFELVKQYIKRLSLRSPPKLVFNLKLTYNNPVK